MAELNWVDIYLCSTHYYANSNSKANVVQWHTAGATLCIFVQDKPEIDLRLEREIVDIRVSVIL
jgi:hypothetical protein